MKKLVFSLFLIILTSCHSFLNVWHEVNISGSIKIIEYDTPVISTVELFIDNVLVSKIDSTKNGEYQFSIKNKYLNKDGFFRVTNVVLIFEKTDFLPKGAEFQPCPTMIDTVPVFINSINTIKNIELKPCKFEFIINEYKHH
tara:strand:+ start:985 stop:1410 length:426 start_codon:yes stop_codon:yes gene_type:complete